jgi:hypothetical protein
VELEDRLNHLSIVTEETIGRGGGEEEEEEIRSIKA